MRDINKKFSVRYYLNLVLIDEEERRYFKQQVIYNNKEQLFSPKSHSRVSFADVTRRKHDHPSSPLAPNAGDHAVEERGRGAEEHVPSGGHRLAEV